MKKCQINGSIELWWKDVRADQIVVKNAGLHIYREPNLVTDFPCFMWIDVGQNMLFMSVNYSLSR